MSTAGSFDDTPIESPRQLAEWLEAGCKPMADWRIGVEHEKFGFRWADLSPLPFDGEGPSMSAGLEGFTKLGWERLEEGGRLVGLAQDGANTRPRLIRRHRRYGAGSETMSGLAAMSGVASGEIRSKGPA